MQEIKIGIVGCGLVADEHLKAFKKDLRTQVVAVCDLDDTRARITSKRWQIRNYYTSLLDLLEHNDIDLVDICTPPFAHKSLAIQAMKSHCHVLIEKPMTMSIKDADEIIKCQELMGVKVGVIHNWLFEQPVLRSNMMINNDQIGDIISVEVEDLMKDCSMAANENHWVHKLPGGRFGEMLAHPIYVLQHFLGKIKLEGVWTSNLGRYPWMKADELCALFRANQKWGRVYVSFNAPREATFITIYGSKAILRLNIIDATLIKYPFMTGTLVNKGLDALNQTSQLIFSTVQKAFSIIFRRWRYAHDTYIQLLTERLIRDEEPPVTSYDAYETIRILEETCLKIDKMNDLNDY